MRLDELPEQLASLYRNSVLINQYITAAVRDDIEVTDVLAAIVVHQHALLEHHQAAAIRRALNAKRLPDELIHWDSEQ